MTSTEKPQGHNQQVAVDSPGDIPGERPRPAASRTAACDQ
jgi:hypothetical protein